MKNLLNIFLIVFVFTTVVGCMDDKTDIAYLDVPPSKYSLVDSIQVSELLTKRKIVFHSNIESESFTVACSVGDTLEYKLKPFLPKNAKEDDYSIKWRLETTDKFIGKGKYFKFGISKEMRGPVAHNIYIVVSKKGEKVINYFTVSFKVEDKFNEGVYILGKRSGNTVLDYIKFNFNYEDKDFFGQKKEVKVCSYKYMENVYKLINGGYLPSDNPVDLEYYHDSGFPSTSALVILDKDYTKSVSCEGKSIKKVVSLNKEFIEVPKNTDSFKNFIVGYPFCNYLLDGKTGHLFPRVNLDHGFPNTGKFGSVPLSYNDPKDDPDMGPQTIVAKNIYEPDPEKKKYFVVQEENRVLLVFNNNDVNYDNPLKTQYYAYTNFRTTYPKGALDLNNIKKNQEIYKIFISTLDFDYDIISVIYKQDGKYYVERFKIDFGWDFPQTPTFLELSVKPISSDLLSVIESGGMENIYLGATYPRDGQEDWEYGPGFIFRSGNKVYLYDDNFENKDILCDLSKYGNVTDIHYIKKIVSSLSSAEDKYFYGNTFAVVFDNTKFKLIQTMVNPKTPDKIEYKILSEKTFDGGVADIYIKVDE